MDSGLRQITEAGVGMTTRGGGSQTAPPPSFPRTRESRSRSATNSPLTPPPSFPYPPPVIPAPRLVIPANAGI